MKDKSNRDKKDGPKFDKKNSPIEPSEPFWRPSWNWHLRSLGIIYVCLIVAYFLISKFLRTIPEPYRVREVPAELTPWLKK